MQVGNINIKKILGKQLSSITNILEDLDKPEPKLVIDKVESVCTYAISYYKSVKLLHINLFKHREKDTFVNDSIKFFTNERKLFVSYRIKLKQNMKNNPNSNIFINSELDVSEETNDKFISRYQAFLNNKRVKSVLDSYKHTKNMLGNLEEKDLIYNEIFRHDNYIVGYNEPLSTRFKQLSVEGNNKRIQLCIDIIVKQYSILKKFMESAKQVDVNPDNVKNLIVSVLGQLKNMKNIKMDKNAKDSLDVLMSVSGNFTDNFDKHYIKVRRTGNPLNYITSWITDLTSSDQIEKMGKGKLGNMKSIKGLKDIASLFAGMAKKHSREDREKAEGIETLIHNLLDEKIQI